MAHRQEGCKPLHREGAAHGRAWTDDSLGSVALPNDALDCTIPTKIVRHVTAWAHICSLHEEHTSTAVRMSVRRPAVPQWTNATKPRLQTARALRGSTVSQPHLSSFGSTKGWHFAKIRSEKNDTAWATLRYACDDSETAVSTPIRRSLRMNSKISNLVHSCSDAARGRGPDCKCKRVCEQSYGLP
jgi:hypothetical protein